MSSGDLTAPHGSRMDEPIRRTTPEQREAAMHAAAVNVARRGGGAEELAELLNMLGLPGNEEELL